MGVGLIIEEDQYVQENKRLSSQFKVAQNAHGRESAGAKATVDTPPPSPRSLRVRFVLDSTLTCNMMSRD